MENFFFLLEKPSENTNFDIDGTSEPVSENILKVISVRSAENNIQNQYSNLKMYTYLYFLHFIIQLKQIVFCGLCDLFCSAIKKQKCEQKEYECLKAFN